MQDSMSVSPPISRNASFLPQGKGVQQPGRQAVEQPMTFMSAESGQVPQPYIIVPYPQYASMMPKQTGSPAAEGVQGAKFFSISITIKMAGQEPESCTTYVPMDSNRDIYRVYKEIFDFINVYKSQHIDARSKTIIRNELDNVTYQLDTNTLSIVSQTSSGVIKYVSDRSKLNLSDVIKKLVDHVQETNVNAATSRFVIPACSVRLTDCFTSRINLDDKTLEDLFAKILDNPRSLFLAC